MMIELFLSAFITFFVVIDPPGCAPIYASLTKGANTAQRRNMALRAVMVASGILLVFALFGEQLLGALHIELNSFRIAGGIILFIVGLQMVFQDHAEEMMPETGDAAGRDVAVFPLALPYIAGPGAMLATMVQTQGMMETPGLFAMKLGALLLVMLVSLVTLLSTAKLNKILGRTGSEVIARVMGILLAALAAESVVRGILEAIGKTPV